jgi:hypothetical protein
MIKGEKWDSVGKLPAINPATQTTFVNVNPKNTDDGLNLSVADPPEISNGVQSLQSTEVYELPSFQPYYYMATYTLEITGDNNAQ